MNVRIADHGRLRTAQTNADRLLMIAASAMSIAGSRISMGDSIALCSRYVPYFQ